MDEEMGGCLVKVETKYTGFAGKDSVPNPEFQVIEMVCPNCHQPVKFPVMDELYDAGAAIEEMTMFQHSMHEGFNGLLEELVDMFPGVPIREFLVGKKKLLMRRLHDELGSE